MIEWKKQGRKIVTHLKALWKKYELSLIYGIEVSQMKCANNSYKVSKIQNKFTFLDIILVFGNKLFLIFFLWSWP